MKDNLKEINEEMREGAAQSIIAFKGLIAASQDTTKTEKERLAIIEEITKTYPDFNAQLLKNKELTKETREEVERYIEQLGRQAKAMAALKIATEVYDDIIEIEQDFVGQGERIITMARAFDKSITTLADAADLLREKTSQGLKQASDDAFNYTKVLERYDDYRERLNKKEEEANQLLAIYSQNMTVATDRTKESNKALEERNKLLAPDIQLGFIKEMQRSSVAYLESMLSDMENLREGTIRGSESFKNYTTVIENLKQQLLAAKGLLFDFGEELKPIETNSEESAKALKDLLSELLLLKHLGDLGSLWNIDVDLVKSQFDIIKEKGIETYEGIAAAATASGEIVSGISTTLFQNEQIRLQNQLASSNEYYDNLISQEENNSEQQELLRRQRRAEELKLRREMAENEKKNALFEIAISTAVGIIKALAMTPPNIPLSIAIAAIGAAQAATVNSQPLPQFKYGRKGGEETFAILGDGYKNEPIIDKHGNLKAISPNRPTMMHLDKGDSVLPDMNRLNDEILSKTMLMNVQASASRMTKESQNKGLERLLAMQNSNIERSIIKSLRKAKFVNNTHANVDLGHEFKINRYRGK
jgi:hypothetical protein